MFHHTPKKIWRFSSDEWVTITTRSVVSRSQLSVDLHKQPRKRLTRESLEKPHPCLEFLHIFALLTVEICQQLQLQLRSVAASLCEEQENCAQNTVQAVEAVVGNKWRLVAPSYPLVNKSGSTYWSLN